MARPNFSVSSPVNWYYSRSSLSGNPPASYNNFIGAYVQSAEALTTMSVNTPDYEVRKARNQILPINTYSKRYDIWKDRPFTWTQDYVTAGDVDTYTYNGTTVQALGGHPFTYFSDVATDDPTQKVIAKLQNQISLGKADALVTLAEAHKTAAAIADTASRIYRSIKALRNLDIHGFTSSLGLTVNQKDFKKWNKRLKSFDLTKERFTWQTNSHGKRYRRYEPHIRNKENIDQFAASTWLEYTYGWKPLLSDVYNFAEASASLGVEMSGAIRGAIAKGRSDTEFQKTYYLNQFKFDVTAVRKMFCAMQVRYRVDDGGPSFETAFGLTNPLLVAWEVVPFSFVADWFLPIGQAIESLTAYRGLTFQDGYISNRQVWTCSVIVTPGKPLVSGSGTWIPRSGAGVFTQDIVIISRDRMQTFPVYGFPEFKNPVSVSHMTSAIALLQSLFRGGTARHK